MIRIPVFLSADDNYAPFVATTIASICDHTQSFIDFYVLDGGITSEDKQKIATLKNKFSNFSVEYIQVDITKYIDAKNYKNICFYVSLATYNRFLIPLLQTGIAKAIYLDVDIICNLDIERLYDTNLKNYPLAAAPDYVCGNEGENRKSRLNIESANPYFNAGVLLIDCEKWRQENISQKLFEIAKNYHDVLQMADQDVLNMFFCKQYIVLDQKFNVIESADEIVLRHFAGMIKPWQADFYLDSITKMPKPIKNTDLFWKYAKMTPFYDDFVQMKRKFLDSNILYQRFNKMIGDKK